MAHYSNPQYWEKRYTANPQPFEWYQSYSELKPHLLRYIKPGSRILLSGCGNSTVGEELYDDASFTDITGVDFSPAVVRIMNERRRNRVGLNYVAMDLRRMEFPPGVFDAVLDKATLDSILCNEEEPMALAQATQLLSEVWRVLRPGGTLLALCHSSEGRQELLEEYEWSVADIPVPRPNIDLLADQNAPAAMGDHHLFVCMKPEARGKP